MKIKVCGLLDPDNISAVAALSPDYMGFITYDKSPRYVAGMSPNILLSLSPAIKKTGVFVDETAETVNEMIERYNFNAVQLHGNESPAYCQALKGKAEVIKAFGISEDFDFATLQLYAGRVDYFLFDTKTPAHGGSGKAFNWQLLNKYTGDIPFFISGGISPENIGELENINHPQFYGVDLNSRFEVSPGLKDIELLKKAFDTIHQTYNDEVRG